MFCLNGLLGSVLCTELDCAGRAGGRPHKSSMEEWEARLTRRDPDPRSLVDRIIERKQSQSVNTSREVLGSSREILGSSRDILGSCKDVLGSRDVLGSSRDMLSQDSRTVTRLRFAASLLPERPRSLDRRRGQVDGVDREGDQFEQEDCKTAGRNTRWKQRRKSRSEETLMIDDVVTFMNEDAREDLAFEVDCIAYHYSKTYQLTN